MKNLNISILGDGGWGTTLALLLNKKGYTVTLWGAFENYVQQLNNKRINTRFLPGIKIPKRITITHNIKEALDNKDIVVVAIPSEYLRQVLKQIRKIPVSGKTIFLSVSKGIETRSLKRMSELIREELGKVKIAVLSGPTIAYETARGIPTTAVIASPEARINRYLQDVFMAPEFRVYTSLDTIGVELGGSLKNIIAIACGVSDGLGFGTNTKAALLARGLAEISRLGLTLGAQAKTFSGITGLGDLVTTCISPYSRNRKVGEELGRGKKIEEIIKHMRMIAEGIPTTKSAYKLAKKHKIDMPITHEVYLTLYKHKAPIEAVRDLMGRRKKEE